MPDVIVTTPQRFIKNSRAEADKAREIFLEEGVVTEYFRNFPGGPSRWPKIQEGDRLYYVEAGFMRGFGIIDRVEDRETGITCGTHGIQWPAGRYVFWPCDSWQWINPIPCTGFQGFRYAERSGLRDSDIEIVGGWLDPMPEVRRG